MEITPKQLKDALNLHREKIEAQTALENAISALERISTRASAAVGMTPEEYAVIVSCRQLLRGKLADVEETIFNPPILEEPVNAK